MVGHRGDAGIHGLPNSAAVGQPLLLLSLKVYELHEMFNFWESQVWIFNDLQEFYDFAYSHVLFDYINRCEDEAYEDDDSDQSELYDYLLKLKNTIWTIAECENFVKTFNHCTFEMVQFGKVSDLIAISD